MSVVLYDKQNHIAWITINRPAAGNVMNAEVFVRLQEAWQEVRHDPDVRVAVLTGAGNRDFCCGGDLAEVIPLWTGARSPQNPLEEKLLADPMIVDKVMLKEPLYKPIIGAINGRALGGGCEILLATDVRVAAENAIFGLPEPKSGLVPGAGTMVRLARQVSYATAMKMMLTAEPLSAAEARDTGLISELVSSDQLQSRAQQLAEIIAANAPLALRVIKQTVLDSHTLDWSTAYQLELEQAAMVMMSKDAREGPRAFKEKRPPHFTGE